MLNTLANHGYIPRNDMNFKLAQLQYGFTKAINLVPDFSIEPWHTGVLASTTGVNGNLNLHDLVKHDLIEHNASLSRLDAYFGNANLSTTQFGHK